MSPKNKKYTVGEVCERCGSEPDLVTRFVKEEWIIPVERAEECFFDEEDVARVRLITELRNEFGVNDEAIPVILHLLDQLYFIRAGIGMNAKNRAEKYPT